ncbi:hypothetical protein Lser_V15G05591 [Lactuca serriola]
MADALVSVAADAILKKVASLAANEIALVLGYKAKLHTLEQSLKMIRAKLQDAENEKAQKHGVMEWLKQLKDVVDEADDVLDEVDYDMLRREVKNRDRVHRKVPSLPSMKKLSFRREIGQKIKNINEKLSQINKLANELTLKDEQPGPVVPDRPYPQTVPNLEKFKIVGREEDEEHIIHLLTESRKEEMLTIVPIVGMGGMGKTTLAKSVYNNPKIQQHFDVEAWVCVSVKVDIKTLLAKIYEILAGQAPKSVEMGNLISALEEKLGSKRYFLVLDDVWDEERSHWEEFKSHMMMIKSETGSGVLVTTRKLDLGTKAMKIDSCLLKSLSDDHCWYIFKERAFLVGQSWQPKLEEIGRDIVKKCRGLPLLVKVIGGVLQNYSDPEKWLAIKNSDIWDLEDERERVQKSLELSIDNLPRLSISKQCFAYCSIFEKDTLMEREELIQLWMALGLVEADDTGSNEMEDVGNDIFQILVSNSLFQDVIRDEYGHITHCSMHGLLHDLSLSLFSKQEGLCVGCAVNDDISRVDKVKQLKHLAVYNKHNEVIEFEAKVSMFIEWDMVGRTLHTLFVKELNMMEFSFQRLKCIRILKLQGNTIWELDDSVGGLVHLRYLDLSKTMIHVLPESIGKLYHLQTLRLRSFVFKQFPEAMRNLISLRYFVCDVDIPTNILGQLISLRKLPTFTVLKSKGHGIEALRYLNNLSGKLRIFDLENVGSKEDSVKAELSGKRKLYDIEFSWSGNGGANRNDKEVLEGLQPPRNVKMLRINKFSSYHFPNWVTKMAINIDGKWTPLDKLVSITLYGCSSCLSLPTLEHLPYLRELVLMEMDNLTCLRSSDVTGSMKPLSPRLRSLRLIRMEKLEKWIDGETNSSKMISPILESLEIESCPRIIQLDECHPHPLVSLRICDCTGLEYIKSIQGLTSLVSLEISYCESLSEITNFPNQCHSLKTLQIKYCYGLRSLPCEMFDCFALLNELILDPFSKELHSFPSLQGIEKLSNHLHSLELWGCDHWELMPEEIQHLTSLTRLCVDSFGIKELPIWLTKMSSIREMCFTVCKGLNKEKVKWRAPCEADFVSLNHSRVYINKAVLRHVRGVRR